MSHAKRRSIQSHWFNYFPPPKATLGRLIWLFPKCRGSGLPFCNSWSFPCFLKSKGIPQADTWGGLITRIIFRPKGGKNQRRGNGRGTSAASSGWTPSSCAVAGTECGGGCGKCRRALPSWPCRRPWPQLPQQAMGFLPERQSNSSSAQFLHFLPSMLSPPEHNLTCQLRLIVLNRTKALKVSALGFVLRLWTSVSSPPKRDFIV